MRPLARSDRVPRPRESSASYPSSPDLIRALFVRIEGEEAPRLAVGKVKLASLLGVVAIAPPVFAEPPFINTVFPPPGFVGPREDPSFPHAQPGIPEHATQCQESGTVKLVLTISAEGRVSDMTVAQSSGFADLDAAVTTQARKWRYLPATKDGAPTEVRITEAISLTAEKHGPNFAADCSRAGAEAAAAALL